jgi:hypothetical protein
VHQFLLQEIVPQFDELGGDLLPLASTSASQEAEDPKINMDLGDRLLGFGRDFGTFCRRILHFDRICQSLAWLKACWFGVTLSYRLR